MKFVFLVEVETEDKDEALKIGHLIQRIFPVKVTEITLVDGVEQIKL